MPVHRQLPILFQFVPSAEVHPTALRAMRLAFPQGTRVTATPTGP